MSAYLELRAFIRDLPLRDHAEALRVLRARFHRGPSCPCCHETNLDLLEWQDDGSGEFDQDVCCQTCGFSWAPNTATLVAR